MSAGFDLVMVYAGAEHIHAEVYLEMGVTEEELGAFHGLGRGSTAAERESLPHSMETRFQGRLTDCSDGRGAWGFGLSRDQLYCSSLAPTMHGRAVERATCCTRLKLD